MIQFNLYKDSFYTTVQMISIRKADKPVVKMTKSKPRLHSKGTFIFHKTIQDAWGLNVHAIIGEPMSYSPTNPGP